MIGAISTTALTGAPPAGNENKKKESENVALMIHNALTRQKSRTRVNGQNTSQIYNQGAAIHLTGEVLASLQYRYPL